MSTRTTTRLSRRMTGMAITAVLALGVVGCTDRNSPQDPAVAADASGVDSARKPQQGQPSAVRAELQGPNSLTLTITSAEREAAGHLTIRGDLTNHASESTVVPAQLRGNERAVVRMGQSLAGATVVDFRSAKRYYVLRDTDGRPLTTTGLSTLKARQSARVFMQFPAPPAATTEVGLQLPLFDTANVRISG
ncbi:hypothetical protein ACIHJG_35450 [Streptomyces sp. NPDC052415]|uniref:hypothetical protein n=1 Tax=Streptomyces sp. NPDC052415 TaxID=3365690 RepID=UPI0037D53A12